MQRYYVGEPYIVSLINVIFFRKFVNILNVLLCTIWYLSYKFKNVKKTCVRLLFLVKTLVSNFTKNNTPPWALFRYFKIYKWYEIAQSISNTIGWVLKNLCCMGLLGQIWDLLVNFRGFSTPLQYKFLG